MKITMLEQNMFFNPLNYLLTLEQAPQGLRNGETFNTLLNPLSNVEYKILVKPESIEMKRGEIEGTLIFDIINKSEYPLMNYSSDTDHYLNNIKVRNVKIDAPYLAPGGGDNIRQSWKSNVTNLRNLSRVRYWIKGYVKGLGYNQNISINLSVKVKQV